VRGCVHAGTYDVVRRRTQCERRLRHLCGLLLHADDNDLFTADLGNAHETAARYSGMWIRWRTLPYSDTRSVAIGAYARSIADGIQVQYCYISSPIGLCLYAIPKDIIIQ